MANVLNHPHNTTAATAVTLWEANNKKKNEGKSAGVLVCITAEMLSAVTEFARGVKDSLTFFNTAFTSRSFKHIALRLLPLYIVATLLGVWFHSLDLYLVSDGLQRITLWTVWNVVCLAPLYLVGAVSQARFTTRILKTDHRAKTLNAASYLPKTWSYIVSETLYGLLLGMAHLVATWVVTLVIWLLSPSTIDLRVPVNVLSVAWASAFSSFECALIADDQNLLQRIHFIETHWAYAFGFGLWVSIFYHILPSAVALVLWQYALLMLMLHGMRLNLRRLPDQPRLRVFKEPQRITMIFIEKSINIIDWFFLNRRTNACTQLKTENF